MTVRKIATIGFLFLLLFLLASFWACETSFQLVIENQTKQVLTVYIYGDPIGNVEPDKQITRAMPGTEIHYLVTAKNSQGEVIFSKTLTRSEMKDLGNNTFKVVISSSN